MHLGFKHIKALRWPGFGVLLLLGISCTRELPYTQDNFKPILVLNAIWGEGDSLQVQLTSSIGILDDTTEVMVTGANVGIRSGSFSLDVNEIGNGMYGANALCQAGNLYQISAVADGFETINASEIAPLRLNATLPDSNEQLVTTDQINIDINDPIIDNFYLVEVRAQRYKITIDPFTLELDSQLVIEPVEFGNTNKIFLSDLEIVSKQTPFELFDDRLFNGRNYGLQIEIPLSESRRTIFQSEAHHYYVTLKSISESYFNFLKNYLIARPVYGGPFESYRQVPTNVEGGAGILGMYSEVADTVFIKKR